VVSFTLRGVDATNNRPHQRRFYQGDIVGKRSIVTIIVSVLAALVVTGGVAAASGYLITNIHQIKPSVRAALKGKRGPRGFTGPQGVPGVPGLPGKPGVDGATLGYESVANGPVDITADVIGQQINLQTIGQLSLPAGRYLVTAKAGYKVMGPAGMSTSVGFDCRLRDSIEGPRDFATVGGWLGAPNAVSQGSFDGTVSLAGAIANNAPATEIVECGDTGDRPGVSYNIDNLVIQAVQVNATL
jgi:hypothetical protein